MINKAKKSRERKPGIGAWMHRQTLDRKYGHLNVFRDVPSNGSSKPNDVYFKGLKPLTKKGK